MDHYKDIYLWEKHIALQFKGSFTNNFILYMNAMFRFTLTDAGTTAPGWSVPLLPEGISTRETPGVMPYSQEDVVAKSTDAAQVPKGKYPDAID